MTQLTGFREGEAVAGDSSSHHGSNGLMIVAPALAVRGKGEELERTSKAISSSPLATAPSSLSPTALTVELEVPQEEHEEETRRAAPQDDADVAQDATKKVKVKVMSGTTLPSHNDLAVYGRGNRKEESSFRASTLCHRQHRCRRLVFAAIVVLSICALATVLQSSPSVSLSSSSALRRGREVRDLEAVRRAETHRSVHSAWEESLNEELSTSIEKSYDEPHSGEDEESIFLPPPLSRGGGSDINASPTYSSSSTSTTPCVATVGHDEADNWKFVTVTSDVVITIAYYAIPMELLYFQRQVTLNDKFRSIMLLFQLFIVCCGTTHLVAVWQPWYKLYFLSSILKLITAMVSMLTACILVHIIPKALALPGMAEKLEEEIGIRLKSELDLRETNEMLLKFRTASQRISDALGMKEMCFAAAQEMCEAIESVSSVALFLPASLCRFGLDCDGKIPEGYVFAAEYSKKFPGSALYGFSWSDVSINESNEDFFPHTLYPGNRLVPLSEENVEGLLREGGSSSKRRSPFPFHSTSVVQFSVDDACRNGLVLISTTQRNGWALKRGEVTLLEDIVHQVEIVLGQTVQMEKEKRRMYELSMQQRKNAELDKAKQIAEMESKLTTEFLASMSHEIRTPMNAIIGFVSYLLQSPDLTADQLEILETISSSSQTLLTILNDILDFSKAETRQLVLKEETFSVRHCLETALQLMAGSADSKYLNLNYFLDEDVPDLVYADPYRLQQIILNLLSNAIKFTEHGEVYVVGTLSPTIPAIDTLMAGPNSGEYVAPRAVSQQLLATPRGERLDVGNDGARAPPEKRRSRTLEKQDKQYVYFHVVDTGIGIPAESMKLLFQKFKQIDSSIGRRYAGTGLGLAISAKLVHMYNGSISVRSRPGYGSAFTFSMELPVYTEASPCSTVTASSCDWAVESGGAARLLLDRAPLKGSFGSSSSSVLSNSSTSTSYEVSALIASACGTTVEACQRLLRGLGVERVQTFHRVEQLLEAVQHSTEEDPKEPKIALVDENLLQMLTTENVALTARYDRFLSTHYVVTLARSSSQTSTESDNAPPMYLRRAMCKPVRRDILRNHLRLMLEDFALSTTHEGREQRKKERQLIASGGSSGEGLGLRGLSSSLSSRKSRSGGGVTDAWFAKHDMPSGIRRALVNLSVLIVDDNMVNRKVMLRLLELFDMRKVEQASNGYEAIAMVSQGSYDVVFMDVAMPVLDGFSATRKIQSELHDITTKEEGEEQQSQAEAEHQPQHSDRDVEAYIRNREQRASSGERNGKKSNFTGRRIPWIIAMTASTLMEERQLCFEAGMNDFLAKPVTPTEISNVLTRFVEQI